MIRLINTNRMSPPVGPVGLDYVASAAREAAVDVDLVDLCLAADPERELERRFARGQPVLVGVTFRNIDDCFWPGSADFVPSLAETVRAIRSLTDAPVVLGGVGFSVAPVEILDRSGADFGIHGDGEKALVSLLRELEGRRRWDAVGGLIWKEGGRFRRNPPAVEDPVRLRTRRDTVDNAAYFRLGGQGGVETKRGCAQCCIYCADPLAKGRSVRLRPPRHVADEVEALLAQGVDVLHLCDSEFNLPPEHAREICEELIRRGLPTRTRWYAYLSVVPFDDDLARLMRRAGCVGINFGADSASDALLERYRRAHRREDIRSAIRLCRIHGIRVMIDLLLGGPGETPETVAETIGFLGEAGPDCVGAALGMRVYPGTPMAAMLAGDSPHAGEAPDASGIRRGYEGPVDFVKPTFYVSPDLGVRPVEVVREAIGGDPRFFAPAREAGEGDRARGGDPGCGDHNYNDNEQLARAIRDGARGAYWDILCQIRTRGSFTG